MSRELWLASALLAGARVKVNDPIRAPDRNRGTAKNILNDLQGVLGELVGTLYVERVLGVSVANDLLNISGPVDDVDLTFDDGQGEIRLECKCHLLVQGKRYLLINERAHERSKSRGAMGYLPVVAALGRETAKVGAVLSTRDVERWGPPALNLRDPALGVGLGRFCAESLGSTQAEVERAIWASREVANEGELRRVASRADPSEIVPGVPVAALADQARVILGAGPT